MASVEISFNANSGMTPKSMNHIRTWKRLGSGEPECDEAAGPPELLAPAPRYPSTLLLLYVCPLALAERLLPARSQCLNAAVGEPVQYSNQTRYAHRLMPGKVRLSFRAAFHEKRGRGVASTMSIAAIAGQRAAERCWCGATKERR